MTTSGKYLDELLQKFCDEAVTGSADLAKPWRDGEYVYASNRDILVRVAGRLSTTEVRGNCFPASWLIWLQPLLDMDGLQYVPVPLPGAATICPECSGVGWFWSCATCGGQGLIHTADERKKCGDCGGIGVVASNVSDRGKKIKCRACNGCGKRFNKKLVRIGTHSFAESSLELLRMLPGVTVAITPCDKHGRTKFEFSDGDGIIMPSNKGVAA